MPTVDELLSASNEVTTCTIDPDTREIIVPEKYKILGVFSDEKVTKIPFTCPKVVGNNVDLTEYNLYINYQNASGGRNAYLVDDVAVSGDNITFSWLLSRYVTLSPGVVTYSLCAKKLDGETTVTEWNTTIAKGTVIPGLETIQEIIEENPDIIETILSKVHTHDNKAVLDKFAEGSDGKPTYNGTAIGGSGTSSAENVSYTNENVEDVTTVKGVLDDIVDTVLEYGNLFETLGTELDQKVSLSDITPEAIGAEAVSTKVNTGTSFAMNDNTEYRLTNVTTLTLHAPYQQEHYECWFSLTFADSGTITVTLPTGMRYIGSAPDFNNGESWEMSIKDGVVIALKIGDGT